MRIASIADQPESSFAAFAASLQSHLAATSRRRLVVDLRGNPGGDNSLNPALVRSLIRTEWVSEPGALFVLIDGGTFSAAMNLAEDLERWLPSVFVGSGTGARPNTYGDALKLVLPRSGLTIRLSSLYWQNHPNDHRAAIDAAPATLAGTWRGSLFAQFRHVEVELTVPESAAGAGSLSIPDLGVEAATMGVAARAGSERLTGWIEYRGNLYPFALARATSARDAR